MELTTKEDRLCDLGFEGGGCRAKGTNSCKLSLGGKNKPTDNKNKE